MKSSVRSCQHHSLFMWMCRGYCNVLLVKSKRMTPYLHENLILAFYHHLLLSPCPSILTVGITALPLTICTIAMWRFDKEKQEIKFSVRWVRVHSEKWSRLVQGIEPHWQNCAFSHQLFISYAATCKDSGNKTVNAGSQLDFPVWRKKNFWSLL